MRVLPILFNTEMVKAILEGRKTVTRRVIKDPYYIDDEIVCRTMGFAMHKGTNVTHGMPYQSEPCQLGDILYVRETWRLFDPHGDFKYCNRKAYLQYFADLCGAYRMITPEMEKYLGNRWHPAIHMPKEAARIFLRVTEVRVERLQEITEEGATSEGLYKGWRLGDRGSLALSARQAFMWLWGHITKDSPAAECWACNPWVWVISFEQCEKPEVL